MLIGCLSRRSSSLLTIRLFSSSRCEGGGVDELSLAMPVEGRSVLVVHPRIRWGRHSPRASTTPQWQLDEAVTLTNTLPAFRVCSSVIVGTDYNTNKKRIWPQGRLDSLVELQQRTRATALMINVDVLSPLQQTELHALFGVPVYDRYNVVLMIFKLFANTKLASLQIQLAQIPYIRHRLKCIESDNIDPTVLHVHYPANSKGDQMEVLRVREQSLKKRISKIVQEQKNNLEDVTVHRGVNATVAIVGYTNAGKSSLIKRLTGDKSVFVEDRLFATLHTSTHFCRLPSGTAVILSDTIGFVSHLPPQLFASFSATLAHVITADVILVVEDVSHPDRLAQREVVIETLNTLHVAPSIMKSVLFVGNKTDKMNDQLQDTISVSCSQGTGIQHLIKLIDQRVMSITGSTTRRIELSPGSPALAYLYNQSLLTQTPLPLPNNKLLCSVVMNNAQFKHFTARFHFIKRHTL